jgi:hypothetical protein
MTTPNPVADAVNPLKVEAIRRARQETQQRIDHYVDQLAAAGWDLRLVAPRPSDTWSKAQYHKALAVYRFVDGLVSRDGTAYRPSWAPDPVTLDDAKVASTLATAETEAAAQYDAFVEKLVAKIGDCDSASLDGSHVWGWSILTVTKGGTVERWKTQQIVNVSRLGKLFNQWPTRQLPRRVA